MGRRREDHWARKARAERYRARSAYKLIEIDDRFKLLRRGSRVLDLGCAPGSWLQVASERVGREGLVVGIDLKPVERVADNVVTHVADVLAGADDLELIDDLRREFDVVLSDMAPNTSGVRDADHYRSVELARRALDVAWGRTRPGSALLMKVFQGPDIAELLKDVKSRYSKVAATRPDSTRSESREIYIIARGRREARIEVG